jgi:formate-dependent nitrite reductase cytochrome c552 subunit
LSSARNARRLNVPRVEAQLEELAAQLEQIEEDAADVDARREAAMASNSYQSAGALDALRQSVAHLFKTDRQAQDRARTDGAEADEASHAAANSTSAPTPIR